MLLAIAPDSYRTVISHLLPGTNMQEQAAYLFADETQVSTRQTLMVRDMHLMSRTDFACQEDDFLELTSEARAKIIKKAHDMNASLIEMHSHPGPWPAAFSQADRIGLLEIVPHMKWRLPARPYTAIVVARSGYDALIWHKDSQVPTALAGIEVGGRIIKPTNLSLESWR